MTNEADFQEQIKRYDQLTQQYHALDEEIDALLATYDGDTDAMADEVHRQYRDLAHQRDEIVNEMRRLEQILFTDDE